MRRFLSSLLGSLLLVGTSIEAYFQSAGFYEEHYVCPVQKYGIPTPLRWEDRVFLAVFWIVAIALFYLSFRLLRYSFKRRSTNSA